jgi:hypothetical protein
MQSNMIRATGSRSLLCNAHHLYNLLDLFEGHIPKAAEVRTEKSPDSTGEWLENPFESTLVQTARSVPQRAARRQR